MNNLPKGVSIAPSNSSSISKPPAPTTNKDNGIPDLSSLLEEEDWIASQVIFFQKFVYFNIFTEFSFKIEKTFVKKELNQF